MTIDQTAVHGKNMYISLNSQDVSGQSNSVSLELEKDIPDTTPFGSDWDLNTEGLKRWTGEVTVFYNEETNEGAEEAIAAWEGTSHVALTIAPKGNSSGNEEWSGNVRIQTVSTEATPQGVTMLTASFTGNGALARAAISP